MSTVSRLAANKHIHPESLAAKSNEDAQLPLPVEPDQADYRLEDVWRFPSMMRAVDYAILLSGLQDGDIYPHLRTIDGKKLDQGTFARWKSGSLNFDFRQIRRFCELVGNRVLLDWVCYQCDCIAIRIKSAVERENESLRAELEKERLLRRHAEDMAIRRG